MNYVINGIQQVGIGVTNAEEAWAWYRKHFGMDVPVFKDAAKANLMTKYTGGKTESRYAILALNMKGGGGFEIWQYTSRKAEAGVRQPELGDLGIIAIKLKTDDINKAFNHLKNLKADIVSQIATQPDGRKHFFVNDPYQNLFQIVESNNWFQKQEFPIGGVCGAIIGVSNTDKTLTLYQNKLQHKELIYTQNQLFDDLGALKNGNKTYKRTLIKNNNVFTGPFSKLLGNTELEFIESSESNPWKTFENRLWGDLGYIHLCFDVSGMNELNESASQIGHSFTVDSSTSFDMGKAAGHFSYIEDPDQTLIEFVETHKVPIIEKLGWYLNLKKRKNRKALPDIVVKGLGLKRVK